MTSDEGLYPFELSEEQESRAARLHRESVVFDACILSGNAEYPEYTAEFLDGGVNGGILTVAHFDHNFVRGMDAVLRFRKLIADRAETLLLATTPEDILAAKRTGRLGLFLGFQDTKPIEDNLEYLHAFYQLGVRMVQLTYNSQNFVGSGCCERHYGGLTHFGRELVREMNRLGVAIDLSHCSDETTMDAIQYSEKPVFFSHSNTRAVCPAYGRNKTDDQIKALVERGGVIGVVFSPTHIKRDAEHRLLHGSVDDVLNHLDHIVQVVGPSHVGFGSDLFSRVGRSGTPLPAWLRRWRHLRPDVFGQDISETWESRPEGLQNGRQLINLTRGLVARGYTDNEIKGFLGGNFLRALSIAWNLSPALVA